MQTNKAGRSIGEYCHPFIQHLRNLPMEVLREKHRSSIEILLSIMNNILQADNAKISKLSMTCNLSYYMLKERLDKLQKVGFITVQEHTVRERLDRTKRSVIRTYSLTNQGKEFLVSMNKVSELLQALL